MRIQGDAAEVIPDLGAFDYLITDPPYPTGISQSMGGKAVSESRKMIDFMFQSFFVQCFKLIKKNEVFRCWIFTDWRQVSYLSVCLRSLGFDKQSCIVWDKMTGTISRNYHPSYEMVLYASNKSHNLGYLGPDLITHKRGKGMYQKPTELIVELIHKFPKGRMLDPFAGSGTSLIAAESLGWDVVGIDIEA